ncbi:hypothetical protein ABZ934_01900 [Streptomyces sp. NPDC046557]|uniref:hypothetical protein n=1 Tax=Streptomyces sp. NPDC046557 TaxID=3155372 RepID=UPI0033E7E38A
MAAVAAAAFTPADDARAKGRADRRGGSSVSDASDPDDRSLFGPLPCGLML